MKKKRENTSPVGVRVSFPSIVFLGERRERQIAYVIPRRDRDLLRLPVSSRADVDQADAEPLQLSCEQNRLLDAPLRPLPIRVQVLLGALRPIRCAEPHKEWALFSSCITDGFDDAEHEAHAILEQLPSVGVRARGCE